MKGDRLLFSGLKPLAGTTLRATSALRMPSMSTSRASVQAMKPVRAKAVGVTVM
jgi:hypothetical protein